jgi:hypothetical protein
MSIPDDKPDASVARDVALATTKTAVPEKSEDFEPPQPFDVVQESSEESFPASDAPASHCFT